MGWLGQFRGFRAWALQITHNRHRYIVHSGKDHFKHYIWTPFYHPGCQLNQDFHLWCHDIQEKTNQVRYCHWFLHQRKEHCRWPYSRGRFEWRCDHHFWLLGKSIVPKDRYLSYLQKALPWQKGRPCIYLWGNTWKTNLQGLHLD